jgi:hypothetical protein
MAAPGRFSSNYQLVREVMQSRKVRAKLDEVARRAAPMADDRAAAEGVDARATLSSGTRPRGRPYARISMPGGTEFGDAKTPRRRVLGRVAAALRSSR